MFFGLSLFDSGAFRCFPAFSDERRCGRPLHGKLVEICKWSGLIGVEGNRKGITQWIEERKMYLTSSNRAQLQRYNPDVHLMIRTLFVLSRAVLVGGALCAAASAQSNPQATPAPAPAAAQAVPVIDGGAGPCSVEFTITTFDGKPAGAATVKVHIAYGFGGFHKLDLQAGANADGKVNFTGLPSHVRRSEMEFKVSKDQLVGTETYNPATECHAKREIKLGNASGADN
jgi:hypothetical protein